MTIKQRYKIVAIPALLSISLYQQGFILIFHLTAKAERSFFETRFFVFEKQHTECIANKTATASQLLHLGYWRLKYWAKFINIFNELSTNEYKCKTTKLTESN